MSKSKGGVPQGTTHAGHEPSFRTSCHLSPHAQVKPPPGSARAADLHPIETTLWYSRMFSGKGRDMSKPVSCDDTYTSSLSLQFRNTQGGQTKRDRSPCSSRGRGDCRCDALRYRRAQKWHAAVALLRENALIATHVRLLGKDNDDHLWKAITQVAFKNQE